MKLPPTPTIQVNHQYSFTPPFDITHFILSICKSKNISDGTFEFSFVNESTITNLNQTHLNHHYKTDTLTFNLGTPQIPHADIYICIPVAEENAIKFNSPFKRELQLLLIHTVLHAIGYTDDTTDSKKTMDTEQTRLLNQLDDTV